MIKNFDRAFRTKVRFPALSSVGSTLLVGSVFFPCSLPFAWQISPVAFGVVLTLTATFHLTLLYGTLRPNNHLFGPVVTRLPGADHGEIWLTIDDGPDPQDTPILLDLLDAAGAKATFFVRGDRIRAHPDLAREILRRGHGLGNHTETHPQASFWRLGPWRLAREIGSCQEAVSTATGSALRFFRAPVGMVNPFVHPAAGTHRLTVVGWTARGFDGVKNADPAQIVRLILRDLRSGGIVLLHEGRRNAAGEAVNVRALELLLPAIRRRGWRAVIPVQAHQENSGRF